MPSSQLQDYCVHALQCIIGYQNVEVCTRPDWLQTSDGRRLELDVFVPTYNIAIEVQGEQHFRYIEFMHGSPEGFADQLFRDSEKRKICKQMGITLLEVATETEAVNAISLISKKVDGREVVDDFLPALKRYVGRITDMVMEEFESHPCHTHSKPDEIAKFCRKIKIRAREKAIMDFRSRFRPLENTQDLELLLLSPRNYLPAKFVVPLDVVFFSESELKSLRERNGFVRIKKLKEEPPSMVYEDSFHSWFSPGKSFKCE